MAHRNFDESVALEAFGRLDERLPEPVRLVLGGGTAMLLAHQHPASTTDADAFPVRGTLESIDPHARAVAVELEREPQEPPGVVR